MDYPNRLEWQTRCEFNAYCKRALRNELIDACRERKRRQLREVIFSDLTPQEERQLYTVDKYFQDGNEEAFCAGGLKITAKQYVDVRLERKQSVLQTYHKALQPKTTVTGKEAGQETSKKAKKKSNEMEL